MEEFNKMKTLAGVINEGRGDNPTGDAIKELEKIVKMVGSKGPIWDALMYLKRNNHPLVKAYIKDTSEIDYTATHLIKLLRGI